MERDEAVELLDDPSLPAAEATQAYRSLARLHHWLGNTRAVLNLLRKGSPQSVVDLGCGEGALLQEIHRRLGIAVTGFDLRPPPAGSGVPILTGDAVVDRLPKADVAIAMCFIHHLSDADVIRLIRNVSRSCRRFIILDLVRHRLPLSLFRIFVGPFVPHINSADGITSVRRAFTPRELSHLVDRAVRGTNARVRHTVAPFYIRQIVDICWP